MTRGEKEKAVVAKFANGFRMRDDEFDLTWWVHRNSLEITGNGRTIYRKFLSDVEEDKLDLILAFPKS